MTRTVIPHLFSLFAGPQDEAQKFKLNEKVIDKFYQDGTDHNGLPVALRWSNHPSLGFPRQPFQVFRRKPSFVMVSILPNTVVIGQRTLTWDRRGMIRVEFLAQPAAGSSLTITALDWNEDPIPGQNLQFLAAGRGRLFGPGLNGLRVSGRGSLVQIRGMDQEEYANQDGWERIELVGLPVKNELDPPEYFSHPQGPEPAALSGDAAGARRVDITRLMHLDPPPTGLVDVPTPAWLPPETFEYLFGSGDGLHQMLKHVYECLIQTKDEDPDRQQVDFRSLTRIAGIQQIEGGGSGSDPADVNLPVVASALLAAASENYAATGLGYGTIDFPPTGLIPQEPNIAVPAGTVRVVFDYMVTAIFITAKKIPLVGIEVVTRLELAALAQLRHNPEPADGLASALLHRNRPDVLDGPESQAARLTWALSSQPQSYGAIRSRAPGQVEVLNAPRLKSGGFEPYMPERPPTVDGRIPATARSTLVDPRLPVPISGTSQVRYLLAALDVFGRWSNWANIQITVSAPAVGKPGLHGITIHPTKTILSGRTVTAALEIVFSWDWFERRPAQVIFRGRFFAPATTPLPPEPAGLRLRSTGLPGPQVVVSFDPLTNQPAITSGHAGSVEQISADPPPVPPPPDTNSAVRQYRLVLEGLECDFAPSPEVAYLVYARAAERVRPAQLSDAVGPNADSAFDPIPPETVHLPADVQYTALPDAAGVARRVLEWPAATNVKGYVIWRATETALLHRIDPALPPPLPGATLRDRATTLRDLMLDTANQNRAAVAFTRLNTELIPGTRFEVELPGAADVLYVYQVTAVSLSNETSPRSNSLTFVAVPRLNQPGEPHAQVRRLEDGSSLRITASPGRGPAPAGYRVFRARNPLLVQEVGLMGPPRIPMEDPGWANVTLPPLNGGLPVAGQAVSDPVSPSWYPYYYRVVALGEQDLPEGQIRGQSTPSTTQEAFLPPVSPPLIDQVEDVEFFGQNASIAVGLRPVGAAYDPRRDRVYVANQFANTVSIINAAANAVIATIPVGPRPLAVDVLPAADLVFVSNSTANTITAINAVTRATRLINVGGLPSGLAIHPGTRRVYVAIPTLNRVAVVDAATGTLMAVIPGLNRPTALAVNPGRNRIYVTSLTANTLTILNGATNAIIATIALAGRPASVDLNPAARRIYVANETGRSLLVFNDTTHALIEEIPLEKIPTQVKVDPRTNRIFVSHAADSSVIILDGDTHTLIEQISLPNRPTGLAVHARLDQVYVTQNSGNTLAVISLSRTATNHVIRFRCDLPVKETPLGEASLEVRSARISPEGQVQRATILSLPPYQVEQGPPLRVLPDATPEQLAAMPEINRGLADSQGRAVYTLRLRSDQIEGSTVLITARDPLKRTTEIPVPEVPA